MSEIERAIEKKEYIERGALIAFVREVRKKLPKDSKDYFTRDEMLLNFRQYLEFQKAADVEPVVRGRWVMDTAPDDGDCRCSNCHVCIDALHRRNHPILKALGYKLHTFYKYCPCCGAKMEDKP